MYVWAKDQKKKEMSSYLKQNKKNRDGGDSKESSSRETGEFGLPVHINRFSISNASILKKPFFVNRTQFQHQDNLVPWKLKGDQDEEKVGLERSDRALTITDSFGNGPLHHQLGKHNQQNYCSKKHLSCILFAAILRRCFYATTMCLKRGSLRSW